MPIFRLPSNQFFTHCHLHPPLPHYSTVFTYHNERPANASPLTLPNQLKCVQCNKIKTPVLQTPALQTW